MYYKSTSLAYSLPEMWNISKHLSTKAKHMSPWAYPVLKSAKRATAAQSQKQWVRFSLESLFMSLHFLNESRERECAALLVWPNDWVVSLAGEGSSRAFIDKHRQDHGGVKRAKPQAMATARFKWRNSMFTRLTCEWNASCGAFMFRVQKTERKTHRVCLKVNRAWLAG